MNGRSHQMVNPVFGVKPVRETLQRNDRIRPRQPVTPKAEIGRGGVPGQPGADKTKPSAHSGTCCPGGTFMRWFLAGLIAAVCLSVASAADKPDLSKRHGIDADLKAFPQGMPNEALESV